VYSQVSASILVALLSDIWLQTAWRSSLARYELQVSASVQLSVAFPVPWLFFLFRRISVSLILISIALLIENLFSLVCITRPLFPYEPDLCYSKIWCRVWQSVYLEITCATGRRSTRHSTMSLDNASDSELEVWELHLSSWHRHDIKGQLRGLYNAYRRQCSATHTVGAAVRTSVLYHQCIHSIKQCSSMQDFSTQQ